jgi:uncharacterized protein YcbK (DUF882 family)
MLLQKTTDQDNQPLSALGVDRRSFFKAGIGVCAMLALPSVCAKTMNIGEKQLAFLNLHTGERIRSTYWAEGSYIPEELQIIESLLRDHRTGELHTIDTRLLDVLQLLQNQIGSRKEFHVISAYRSPKTNAMLASRSNKVGKKSLHMQGRAIDVRLPEFALSELRKAALSLKIGGVGYYPKSNFVHIDTGRVRFW